MSKKKTKKRGGSLRAVRIAVALFLILGGALNIKEQTGAAIVSILIGCVLLFWKPLFALLFLMFEPKSKVATASETPASGSKQEIDLLQEAFDYSYTDVGLYRPPDVTAMPNVGDTVLLELEPDNPYDSKTVRAVRWTDAGPVVFGYMNKGKLRDMVTDFLNRGQTVVAKVTRADDKVEIWIGMDR